MARRASGRHLFTAVLIVFAVLVSVLWWRSRTKVDAFVLFVGRDGRAQVLASSAGRVCIALTNIRCGRDRAWTAMCGSSSEMPAIVTSGLDVTRIQIYPPADPAKVAAGGSAFGDGYLGFSFASSQTTVLPELANSQLVYALIPHWAIAVPLLLWSLWRLFGPAAERQRRLRKGQCVSCGYDLRASAGRCPECGAEIGDGARSKAEEEPAEVAS
jgi:hypothetical protein